MENTNNNKTERLIILILLILFGCGIFYHFNRIGTKNSEYEAQVKLTEALTDSIRIYQTKNGELVYEKRTLQGDIDDLSEDNVILSQAQKELLNEVQKLNKERKKDREIFAAARIEYQSFIDSINSVLASATNVDTLNNVVSFASNDTAIHFIYDLDIMGVRPFPENTNPNILFNRIDFPNKQFVSFNFDKNKRKDYPVSFSVKNTNPYYKPFNIESYAIQGITKDNVNPTGWKKAWNWIKLNGKYVLVGAAGFAVGGVVMGN